MSNQTITEEYIEANTFAGGGYQTGEFFIKLPSGFCERIPGAKDLEDAKAKTAENRIASIRREEYFNNKGTKCPLCNSTDFEGAAVDIIEGKAYQKCHCLSCNSSWEDTYLLARMDITEHGETT